MTIINQVVHRGGVILFADTAVADEVGRLSRFASKIHTPGGHLFGWMAMGSGDGARFVAEWLPAHADFDYAVIALPDILRLWLPFGAARLGDNAHIQVLFAGWSESRREWAGAIIDTLEAPGRPAFQIADAGVCIGPCAIGGAIRPFTDAEILKNIAILKPVEFARRVLNARRRASALHDGKCISGGAGEFVTITDDGVKRKNILVWPDAVGDTAEAVAARALAAPAPKFLT
ncbi:hypothetical protein [Ancylobacter sp. FA202]|uniref:hypothetical protein n=1 Tax=Ancylobacter sp. FA202 TaxID=1111106 RepID=UPI00035D062A|nr:hypothetical protein [Ancylobacter sp. FA202]